MKYTIVLFRGRAAVRPPPLTPHRRVFGSKWFWLGCVSRPILIFLPHFVCSRSITSLFLEYEHNVRMNFARRNVRRGHRRLFFWKPGPDFLILSLAILWIGGLLWLLLHTAPARATVSWPGPFWCVVVALIVTQGKNYYGLGPFIHMMFARRRGPDASSSAKFGSP